MKALVKYQRGRGFVEIRDVPVPAPEEDEVLIKVAACGVCGSDIHILNDEFPNDPPAVMGHELSGTVEEVGKRVSAWRPGDRVVTELHTGSCGRCKLCRTGNQHVCISKRPLGSRTDGGFAEYVKVPERLIHKVPESLDLIDAALTEPTAICVHGVTEAGNLRRGDFVVILGAGPIGLISGFIAKRMGAGQVVLAGTNKDKTVRLAMARELGLDRVVNVEREDLPELVSHLTQGMGADVVVEASGAPAAVNQAVQMLRPQGRIIAIGLTSEERIPFNWNRAVIREMKLSFAFSSTWTSWEEALRLLSTGAVQAKKLTGKRPLEEWKEAFEDLENCRVIKTLLTL